MISRDLDDISADKFDPNQNKNLNNISTRGFLWEDGNVGERNWWVPKNWKSEEKVKLMLLLQCRRTETNPEQSVRWNKETKEEKDKRSAS